jgi:hypothetical protein
MNTDFNEDAVNWLKRKGFSEDEIKQARDSLEVIWKRLDKGGETFIKLPKGASRNVASIVYAVAVNSDYEGRPIGFEKNGLISIGDGAKKTFNDDMELGEYEEVLGKISKIKLGRTRSDPRSRLSVKKD